ncbi:hypothetical protein G6F56_003061 [Rhizopus delemar]|nr:hypothetical protein G6F56_003061 [Rhizopus delemar]
MKEVLHDFGTVYSIWLCSFERYDKLIKNLDTNNKDHFKLTFLKSFLKIKKLPKFIVSFSSDQLQPEHKKFLQTFAGFNSDTRKKSIGYSATAGSMQAFYHLSSVDAALTGVNGCEPLPWVSNGPYKSMNMKEDHFKLLLKFYATEAYQDYDVQKFNADESLQDLHKRMNEKFVRCNKKILMSSYLMIAGERYNSTQSTSVRGSHIRAYFSDSRGLATSLFPGQIILIYVRS